MKRLLHPINSLPKSYVRSGCRHLTRKAKRLANRRLLLQRMTRFFKRCSTGTTRMLPLFVRLALKSSPPRSVRGRSGFWTSPSVADCLYRSHTTAQSQDAGRQPKAAPSTCRTSSVGPSCVKQLWLPRTTSLSLATSPRLSREYSRGWRTTKTCSSSSGRAVTLTLRSALRCSTFPDLLKKAIPTYGSLRKARCLAAVTDLDGPRLQPSFWLVSSVRRLSVTIRASLKNWASLQRTSRSSLSGTTTSRS